MSSSTKSTCDLYRIEKRLVRLIAVCTSTFKLEKFIPGLKRLDLVDPVKKIKKIFKVYKPVVASFPLPPPLSNLWKGLENESQDRTFLRELYLSQLAFLQDILTIPRVVDHSKSKGEKKAEIMEILNEMNKQLPSFVYVPSESKLC